MTEKISRHKYEDQLLQLLYLAEANLKYCLQLRKFIERKKEQYRAKVSTEFINEKVQYLILVSNNHFLMTVLIVDNLLREPRKYKTLSFQDYLKQNYLKKEMENLKNAVESLWKEYKDYGLNAIRDQIAGHQDKDNIGDAFYFTYKLINDMHINNLNKIIKGLKYMAHQYFEQPISNNYIYRETALSEIMGRLLR